MKAAKRPADPRVRVLDAWLEWDTIEIARELFPWINSTEAIVDKTITGGVGTRTPAKPG